MSRFVDRVVVVTGAATGIGAASARAFSSAAFLCASAGSTTSANSLRF